MGTELDKKAHEYALKNLKKDRIVDQFEKRKPFY